MIVVIKIAVLRFMLNLKKEKKERRCDCWKWFHFFAKSEENGRKDGCAKKGHRLVFVWRNDPPRQVGGCKSQGDLSAIWEWLTAPAQTHLTQQYLLLFFPTPFSILFILSSCIRRA